MDELIESGTLLTLIEMLSLENPTEADKNSSIRVVYSISLYGLKYKEIICKVGSIRVICECLGTVENKVFFWIYGGYHKIKHFACHRDFVLHQIPRIKHTKNALYPGIKHFK